MSRVVLLGPQRFVQTIGRHLRESGIAGPVATVTAGWQGRESDIKELDHYLGVPAIALRLYERAEALMRQEPELLEGLQERHDRLRSLQRLYRIRLGYVLAAAKELMAFTDDEALIEPEREAAIDAVRQLDARHLDRKLEVQAAFDSRWRLDERESVVKEREEIRRILSEASALVITGGHVGVLRNRLWLFDVFGALTDLPIFSWSAGAMAISERVVLFHDTPPQGAGNAEVHAYGFGLAPGIVPLPHARRRLRLDDPERVALFARRFAPAACVTLEEGGALEWDGEHWTSTPDNLRLTDRGTLERMTDGLATESMAAPATT